MIFDLVIRNGRIVTADADFHADIGIRDGLIESIGEGLAGGRDEIDATGMLVLPGGVDAHCHIEEPAYMGARNCDDFHAASRAAACGGTTTIIPFLNQQDGMTLMGAFDDYLEKASRSLIDFSFHVLLKNAGRQVLEHELRELVGSGIRSVKVFMTYEGYRLDDAALLDVMASVAEFGGTVMVHAENGAASQWNEARLAAMGHTGLSYFAAAYPTAIEREATHRAIALAELTGVRLMIVHVTCADALEQIAWAKKRNLPVLAETCPHYLFDFGQRMQSDDWETAKLICSPPIRGTADASALWDGLSGGAIDIVSSDHCPYRFEGEDGKKGGRTVADFRDVPRGLPGLETRMPLLFKGVTGGKIDVRRFVELTATRPAQIYGLYPRKGGLLPGGDADLALWEVASPRPLSHRDLHDLNDHSPFEGEILTARPVTTIARGRRIWDKGTVIDEGARGRFIASEPRPS